MYCMSLNEALKSKFVIERVMKDSESCTLHEEEGNVKSKPTPVHCVHASQTERDAVIHTGSKDISNLFTSSSSRSLIKQSGYTLEELPVIIWTIYYSTSPVTQFWFDGGFSDSPELSKKPRHNHSGTVQQHQQCSLLCEYYTVMHLCLPGFNTNICCSKNILPTFFPSFTESSFF